jgi:Domain of unknown function (DUF4157)
MFPPLVKAPKARTASHSVPTRALKAPQHMFSQHGLGAGAQMLILQRAIGNQAILRLLSQRAESRTESTFADHQKQEAVADWITGADAAPSPAWDFSKTPLFAPDPPSQLQASSTLVQPKLVIRQVNDPLEYEGDQVTDQMMRNQAVQQVQQTKPDDLEARSSTTAVTRFDHEFSQIPTDDKSPARVQAKLRVSPRGDIYEQEADLVSEQVMRMSEPRTAAALVLGTALGVQRKCSCDGTCPNCQGHNDEQHLHVKFVGSIGSEDTTAPPIVHEVLNSPGQPLDSVTRAFMEPRFGHDFSNVRVHTDTVANASARAVNARAYTVGHDIVFGTGQHAPATAEGIRLIAHELAHVVQQREGATGIRDSLTIAPTHDRYEQEADQTAEAVTRENAPAGQAVMSLWSRTGQWMVDLAQKSIPRLSSGLRLQRQPCRKADDRIVTGPLPQVFPPTNCEPRPETLATVRATGGSPTILGHTQTEAGGQQIRFEEIFASKCRATIIAYDTLNITNFVYTKAGTYDDGTEVTPEKRPCPQGRIISRKTIVTEQMARKLRLGESEHCEDAKLAFALSMGKFNQAIKDLEGEFCPGVNPPECREEFAKRFEERTGIEFAKQNQIISCLTGKSRLRDANHWHDVLSTKDDVIYAPNCSSVTYILNPDLSPHIGTHPPAEIVKGCGEK